MEESECETSSSEGEISVLELPQIWQKPAFQELLHTLKRLYIEPPIWNIGVSRAEIQQQRRDTQGYREFANYLGNVIKSDLKWIEDEQHREEIWTEASKRLSERCGRAGRFGWPWSPFCVLTISSNG